MLMYNNMSHTHTGQNCTNKIERFVKHTLEDMDFPWKRHLKSKFFICVNSSLKSDYCHCPLVSLIYEQIMALAKRPYMSDFRLVPTQNIWPFRELENLINLLAVNTFHAMCLFSDPTQGFHLQTCLIYYEPI